VADRCYHRSMMGGAARLAAGGWLGVRQPAERGRVRGKQVSQEACWLLVVVGSGQQGHMLPGGRALSLSLSLHSG